MTCSCNRALPCDCEKRREQDLKRSHQDLVVKFLFHLILDNPSVASASELVQWAERKARLFEESVSLLSGTAVSPP